MEKVRKLGLYKYIICLFLIDLMFLLKYHNIRIERSDVLVIGKLTKSSCGTSCVAKSRVREQLSTLSYELIIV